MNRTTSLFANLLGLLVATTAVGQNPKPTPQFPEDIGASRQLIAWSWMQKPQPIPQPQPPRDTQIPQPGQRAKPPANPHTQQQGESPSLTREDGGGGADGEAPQANLRPER